MPVLVDGDCCGFARARGSGVEESQCFSGRANWLASLDCLPGTFLDAQACRSRAEAKYRTTSSIPKWPY